MQILILSCYNSAMHEQSTNHISLIKQALHRARFAQHQASSLCWDDRETISCTEYSQVAILIGYVAVLIAQCGVQKHQSSRTPSLTSLQNSLPPITSCRMVG